MTSLPSLTNGYSPAPRSSQSEVGPTDAGVVIDCTSMRESPADLDRLIAWMGSCPRDSGMQVYLPSAARRASMQKFQRSLQSIGCTVTLRPISSVRVTSTGMERRQAPVFAKATPGRQGKPLRVRHRPASYFPSPC